uniref:Secreted protein n=1 Tax=Plectus sambesii TaxID=2011161 RepID=A0A914XJQ2_9BILA
MMMIVMIVVMIMVVIVMVVFIVMMVVVVVVRHDSFFLSDDTIDSKYQARYKERGTLLRHAGPLYLLDASGASTPLSNTASLPVMQDHAMPPSNSHRFALVRPVREVNS